MAQFSQYHEIVAVDDLVVSLITQHFFNLACMQSFDLIQLVRAVVHQPAGELVALQIQAAHAFADAEYAANFLQTGRKQAPALLHESLVSARVDDNVAGRL